MIVVRLAGGLGNQLFQYAAARRLAYRHKVDLLVEDSFFVAPRKGDTPRSYELCHFKVASRSASDAERRSFVTYCQSPWYLFRRLLPLPGRYQYVRERHFHFDPRILSLPNDVFLDGYWQSEKYFVDISDVIRAEFEVKEAISQEEQEITNEILGSTAVSLHIRRGDYVTNAKTATVHGTCSTDYYHSAIAYVTERIPSASFFVFSEDPDWARHHLSIPSVCRYIANNQADTAFRDLRLMSICKHHIIANSSFSWWGAWLNPNPGKIVIAPKRWFSTDRLDTRDLIPETWVRL